MDIGYHYLPDQVNPLDPPRNLDFSPLSVLSWDPPVGSTPSYLVIAELPGGDLMDFYWTGATHYNLPTELQNMNLWCCVMSHEYQTNFSDPVWIEYN